MNPLTPLFAHRPGGPIKASEAVRAASNTSDSAQLGQQHHDAPRERSRARPRLQVELVCQGDTKAADPFRDAPRLTPAFVTQLLGQVMTPERHRLVRTIAYGAASTKDGAVLDTRL